MSKNIVFIFACLLTFNTSAKPPQVAFDACNNKASQASCTINTPRGVVSGVCQQTRRGNELLCVPEHHQRGKRERRPKDNRAFDNMLNNDIDTENGRGFGTRFGGKRQHTTVQSDGHVNKVSADNHSHNNNQVSIATNGRYRIITANGIPNHAIGQFPNRDNPHSIQAQDYQFEIPLNPKKTGRITPLEMNSFGVAINGVVFDPNAAEWYQGDRGSEWRYEALSNAVPLGIDENNAHIQPNGAYHYHGLTPLTTANKKTLVGWAADGFPIYQGASNARSSYKLKQGERPNPPGGYYDGTFVNDYQFITNSGTLDECNGMNVIDTAFPDGTYAYFLTQEFPVIPRCFKGVPSADFSKRKRRF